MTVVVDTNVLLVANGQHQDVSRACIESCTTRLHSIVLSGRIAIDDGYRILKEYQNKTEPFSGMRAGDAFLKWLLRNNANPQRCEQVPLVEHAERGFESFPDDERTPHLAWLGSGKPREDKVLGDAEAREFLSATVVVEEKLDGANLGFSVDERGRLRGQNRGSYLDLDDLQGQWKPLKRWLSGRQHALTEALAPDLMLFGEWCYAMHSVHYVRLSDWFFAFDVFDRAAAEFWSVDRRNEFALGLCVEVVPELGRGRFRLDELKKLLGRSAVTEGPAEGLYVRRELGGRLLERGKLVRAEFVQSINEHWSKRHLERNRLVREAS